MRLYYLEASTSVRIVNDKGEKLLFVQVKTRWTRGWLWTRQNGWTWSKGTKISSRVAAYALDLKGDKPHYLDVYRNAGFTNIHKKEYILLNLDILGTV